MGGKRSRLKVGVALITGVALFILFSGFVVPELGEGGQQAWAGLLLVVMGGVFILLSGGATLRCDRAQNVCTLTKPFGLFSGRRSVKTFRLETLRGARAHWLDLGDSAYYSVTLETGDGPVEITTETSKSRAGRIAKRINRFVHSRAGESLVVRCYSRAAIFGGAATAALGTYWILRAVLG